MIKTFSKIFLEETWETVKDELGIKMENEDDLFYFESEHVAVKGNRDYSELLKTIVILEAQKTQAIQDIEKLLDLQMRATKDPIGFMEKIKNKENLGLPFKQKIPQIPYINWSKYNVPVPEEALKLINEGGSKYVPISPHKKPKHHFSSTHKQPWTAEEQKKLEELLVKYPPEAIEMRRFKKIANELGNRTVVQVTSRVQKYFLKLYKAGLPVPGRIPKTADRKKIHKHQRHNYLLCKPSTFFPDTDVPVFMTEDDDDNTLGPNIVPPSEISDRINVPNINTSITKNDEITLRIDLLRKIKMEKTKANNLPSAIHVGYTCDLCNEEPIKGCRWNCVDCKQESVDFCTDCLISQLNSTHCHPLTHEFVALHKAEVKFDDSTPGCSGAGNSKDFIKSENDSSSDSDSYSDSNWYNTTEYNSEDSHIMKDYDEDYITESSKKYNYLDPNFLPELYKN